MEKIVTFDDNFFKNLKYKWLNTKELFLLLSNIDELLEHDIVKLSVKPNTRSVESIF
jgi:hypothetical protein